MMSVSHRYQDFGSRLPGSEKESELSQSKIEDDKLASFEAGFQAGWEDALKAQTDTHQHISSDFAKNLQEASFSYHEARSALIKSLRPLFTDITNMLLPIIAQKTLGPHVIEQLTEMTREQVDQMIEITVAPDNTAKIETLLGDTLSDPFVLLSDAQLGTGQVYLRIGAHEREIDLDQIIASISDTTDAFFQHAQEDVTHG